LSVPLSVVIGTTEGWPYVRPLIEALRGDAQSMGAEVLIADGSDGPPPSPADIYPEVRWLKFDTPVVFALYGHGIRAARGDIIALTEDHALPRPGWIPAIVRAHAEHPEAAAIGGSIENGSRQTLLDWASYFITQGIHMAPLGDREVPITTNEADVSYKRGAVETLDDNGGLGFMAILHNRRLADSGAVQRVDDRIRVDHYQTIGLRRTMSIHYHNGRSISGFRRASGMTPEDWARMVASLVLPFLRTARAIRVLWPKRRHRRELLASAPLMLSLDLAQGVGHLIGYAAGAGDSPNYLR
jgi:hypothetical protein